jgi:hypothetical protein
MAIIIKRDTNNKENPYVPCNSVTNRINLGIVHCLDKGSWAYFVSKVGAVSVILTNMCVPTLWVLLPTVIGYSLISCRHSQTP